MIFYIWGIFHYQLPVPTGRQLHQASSINCQFYPFRHESSLFTIDSMLWKGHIEEFIHPSLIDVNSEVLSKKIENRIHLIAISFKNSVPAIGFEDDIILEEIPKSLTLSFLSNYNRLGVDVIDIMGISGLANIGYNFKQAECLMNLNIEITPFGLIDSYKQASQFASIISKFAPEHSPFIPVEIWKNKEMSLKNTKPRS
ncbi:hypothetical protein IH94_01120 [Salmonella enterica]|nr:hypothetical protein [Salmonella enterica]EIY7072485.1 hypothetical protein [Salmonella enterica]